MGAESYILAIGPFYKDISMSLEYPSDHYEYTEIGSTVTTSLFHCSTSNGSDELASLWGMEGLMDFTNMYKDSQYYRNMPDKTFDRFLDALERHCLSGYGDRSDVKKFGQLVKSGFSFMFMPEY
jgi:hypothetical protein